MQRSKLIGSALCSGVFALCITTKTTVTSTTELIAR